ncbi:hypothetical protein MXB_1110, partial [Myxobolus squamalis]
MKFLIKDLWKSIASQGKCCNWSTCKFTKRRYQCFKGKCCRNCKFEKNKICRSSQGSCDYPDRCDGRSG